MFIQFMEDMRPKLADFGTARLRNRMDRRAGEKPDRPGTAFYQAPEVQVNELAAQPHSDVWTLCLVLPAVEIETERSADYETKGNGGDAYKVSQC